MPITHAFPTFEEWLKYIFEQDSRYPDIDIENANDWWILGDESRNAIEYLTRLFLNADELLKQYPNENVSHGLHFLASNNFSNTMFALMDEAVPWLERQRCIQSMYYLFPEFFPKRCSPQLYLFSNSTLDIDFVCCYWFDLMPIHGRHAVPANVNREFLDLYRKILRIKIDICREAALCGLGSWHLYHPVEVGEILDEFLSENPNLSAELRKLAEDTRHSRYLL